MENNYRYNLNMTLNTCQNICNNDNKLHVIDFNNFVKYFYLTKDKYYLSKYLKRQIASSLSYFIYISAKNLANKAASIEQPNNVDLNSAIILANYDIENYLN